MRDHESTQAKVQRRTKPGAKGSKIAGPPAPSAARKKQLNRVAAAGKALTNLARTAQSNAPGAPGSKIAGPPAPTKPKYRAPKKDVVGKGVKQRSAIRLIDPIPLKSGHYRKGQGPLLRSQASIDLGRLLGRKVSAAEKSRALTRLQNAGHLPGDTELKSIATGKPAVLKVKGDPRKRKIFPEYNPARRFDPKTMRWEEGYLDKKGTFKHNDKPHNPIEVLEAPIKVAGKLAGAGVKLATGNVGGLGAGHARAQRAGFAPSFSVSDFKPGKAVTTAVGKGALATGSAVVKGLSIPLEAAEYGAGKGLVAAGAIKGDTAREIRKAKFGQIHGEHITKGLGLPRQAGLGVDLTLDPIMWIGAGLAPETGGGSLALTIDRIRRVAPELLQSEKAVEALKVINGEHSKKELANAVKALQSLAKPSAVRAIQRKESQKLLRDIAEGRRSKGGVIDIGRKAGKKQKTFVLPGEEGVKAAELALRSAEARRVRPAVRLQMMTPLGSRTIRGRQLPSTPALPLGKLPVGIRTQKQIDAIREEAANVAATNLAHEYEQKIAPLRARAKELRAKKKNAQANKIEAEIRKIKEEYDFKAIDVKRMAADEALARRVGRGDRRRLTLNDRVDLINRRTIATHQGMQFATEHGRTVENLTKKAIQDAVKPLGRKGRTQSLKRVQLVLSAEEASPGGAKRLADAITLNPSEQRVANNLRTIYDELARHGEEVGTLPRSLDRYAGMRIWDKEFDPSTIEGMNNIVNRVLAASHTKGRKIGSVTEHAGRRELAEAIRDAADKPISLEDAATMADRLFHTNPDRALSELTVRRLQRGEHINYKDLTGSEKLAIRRAEERGFDPRGASSVPLFRTPMTQDTEGFVLPGNFEHYGIPESGIDSAKNPTQAALYSQIKDRQRVDDMLAHAEPGSQLHEDLQLIRDRLTDDIRKTDPESAKAVQRALEEPVARENYINRGLGLEDEDMAHIIQASAARDVAKEYEPLIKPRTRVEVIEHPDRPAAYDSLEFAEQRLDDAVEAGESKDEIAYLTQKRDEAQAALDALPDKKRRIPNPEIVNVKQQIKTLDDAIGEMQTRVEQTRNVIGTHFGEQDPQLIERQFGAGAARIDEIPPGNATVSLDEDGIAWLRGPDSKVELPEPEERMRQLAASDDGLNPGPFDDPYDWTSTLPDFREHGAMFELDPRLTGGVRARQQGFLSQMNARWQMIDKTHGISKHDADASTVTIIPTGETVSAQDLVPVWHDNRIDSYYLADNEHWHFDAEDLRFNDDAPLRKGIDGLDYVDLRNGQRYIPVSRIAALEPQKMIGEIADDRLWPAQAIADVTRHMGQYGEFDLKVFQTGMEHGWRKLMSSVRFGVTTPFPAYHVRNLISDALKSLQADSGVMFHPIVNTKLAAAAFGKGLDSTLKIPGYGKMTVEDFLFLADTFGVRTGHHVAEVQQIMRGNQSENALRAFVSQLGPNGFMSKFGASREDIVRYQTFFQRLRRNGGDAADAAWYTIRHHFNYNDLNVNERRFARNVFLFYTWYRKNVPLQLVELARRPGFFSGVETAYRDLASGETPVNFGPFDGAAPAQPGLPEYVHDKLQSATVDWKGYAANFGFGAPWSDLALASGKGVGDLLAMVNPVGLVAGEGVLSAIMQKPGIDPLTGRTYKELEPSPLLEALGVKPSANSKTGDKLYPWYWAYLARQTPFLGRLSYGFGGTSATRDQGRLQTLAPLLSPLTGINVYVSPKPGSEREKFAVDQYSKSYTGKMKTKQENISNMKRDSKAIQRLNQLVKGSKEYKRAYDKLDPDTKRYLERIGSLAEKNAEDAKRRGIDITKVKNSGSYKRKQRSSGGRDYGLRGGLGNGSGGLRGGLGG